MHGVQVHVFCRTGCEYSHFPHSGRSKHQSAFSSLLYTSKSQTSDRLQGLLGKPYPKQHFSQYRHRDISRFFSIFRDLLRFSSISPDFGQFYLVSRPTAGTVGVAPQGPGAAKAPQGAETPYRFFEVLFKRLSAISLIGWVWAAIFHV